MDNLDIKITFDLFFDNDKIVCPKCKNDLFTIFKRLGSGNSGTFLKLVCVKCDSIIYKDFENPNYEG